MIWGQRSERCPERRKILVGPELSKEGAVAVGAGLGAAGAIARGPNPDREAASMNGRESLANSRNHSSLLLE